MGSGLRITYYIDLNIVERNPLRLEYLAADIDSNFDGWDKGYQFILGIGNNHMREKIGKRLSERNQSMPPVIDSQASVSGSAQVGAGSFISRNGSVNALAVIGEYVIINTGAVVEHECIIGSGAHIAPGAILAGNVKVGDRSFIGANSVVKQGITIGSDVIIGAGSVIIRNIPDGVTMVGNPARRIK